MQNITIGRYRPADFTSGPDVEYCGTPETVDDPHPPHKPHAGWIEGVRDDGSTWIMFLDGDGSPQVFFAVRSENGAVISDPVILDEPTFHEGGGTPVE